MSIDTPTPVGTILTCLFFRLEEFAEGLSENISAFRSVTFHKYFLFIYQSRTVIKKLKIFSFTFTIDQLEQTLCDRKDTFTKVS